MSVFEGMRALRGAPGSKVSLTIFRGNANDPHVVELTREATADPDVTGRMAAPGVGYLRIAADRAEHRRSGAGADRRPDKGRRAHADRRRAPDLRRLVDAGLALARLFVGDGTLACARPRAQRTRDHRGASGRRSDQLPTARAHRQRNVRRRGTVRVGARRQQAR